MLEKDQTSLVSKDSKVLENTSHASNFQTLFKDQKLNIETDQRMKAGEMSYNLDSLTKEENLAQIIDSSPSYFPVEGENKIV